jgi:hypothetical protein
MPLTAFGDGIPGFLPPAPPMSHAANMDLLDMVKTIAALGAKDFQHAFDRALLHGDIETAQWLHEQGAAFTPGIIMGSCETLNDRGFGFLVDAGAPLTDGKRDAYMAQRLLALGADINIRVNLRKYLDWRDEPGWHTALNVTPLEWAAGFPERGWVNREAIAVK